MKRISIIFTILLMAMVSLPAQAATKWTNYRIMLDPGHGGSDPGASGPSAPHEATLALRCGLALKKRIVNDCGGTVKMTRETDVFISLTSRRNSSVSYDPYIFCSIHLNAFNKTAKGTETYYYWSEGNSYLLAQKVQAQLIANFKTVSGFTPTNRGVKYGNLAVIKGSSSVPAILTEGLFVDNTTEWNIIKSESLDGFKKWVQGHLYGFYDRLVLLKSDIVDPSGSTVTVPDPTMTVNPTSMSFSCNNGETRTNSVSIKGSNLTSAVTASISGTGFSISSKSLSTTGGSVTVKFAPTSVGTFSGTLTLKSGSLTKTVSLSGTASAAPLTFTEGWNASDQKSTLTKFGWDAGKVRNMTYNAGKLYLVYNHSDIKVVNAQTGADLGNLNKAGVESGTLTLCDVKCCDGKIVACNLATSANNNALRVYVWDDDQSNPRLLLNTTNFGGAERIGDYIGFYGTWTSGQLVFGHYSSTVTRVISYAITNGVCATTPTVVNATTDGSAQLNTGGSTRVYPGGSYFWIDGKNNHASRHKADGSREYYIDDEETWGTALHIFTWQGTQYGLQMMFNTMEGENWSSQTDAQKAKNYTGGRMRLIRPDESWSKPTDCGQYPSAGLSSTVQNTNCTGNVIAAVNGDKGVEAWVLSTGQGIAYFKHGTVPTNTVEEIKPATPTITPSATSISFSAQHGATTTKKVKISGSSLKGDISIALSGTDADMFSIDKTSIAQASAANGVDVTITYSPRNVGSHTAKLTLTSTEATSVDVTLKGTATEATYLDDNVIAMQLGWNTPSWADLSTNLNRAITYKGGKIYALSAKSWAAPVINIVDAYAGTAAGTLSVEGLQSATFQLSDIEAVGNKIIGCNGVSASQVFRVYRWDSDTSKPVQILEDATHGGVATGGQISISGDLTNGRLWTLSATGTQAIYYTISNGTVNATANVINLTTDGTTAITGTSSYGQGDVIYNSDGTFWVDTKDIYPTLFDATGKQIAVMKAAAFGNNQRGTSMKFFNFGSKKYAVASTYLGSSSSTLHKGGFVLIDITSGAEKAEAYSCRYPENGFTETTNAQFVTSVCYGTRDDNTTLDVWVNICQQGVAHYTYKGLKTNDIEPVVSATQGQIIVGRGTVEVVGMENVTIGIYSTSGALVACEKADIIDISALAHGIYIVTATDANGNTIVKKIAK